MRSASSRASARSKSNIKRTLPWSASVSTSTGGTGDRSRSLMADPDGRKSSLGVPPQCKLQTKCPVPTNLRRTFSQFRSTRPRLQNGQAGSSHDHIKFEARLRHIGLIPRKTMDVAAADETNPTCHVLECNRTAGTITFLKIRSRKARPPPLMRFFDIVDVASGYFPSGCASAQWQPSGGCNSAPASKYVHFSFKGVCVCERNASAASPGPTDDDSGRHGRTVAFRAKCQFSSLIIPPNAIPDAPRPHPLPRSPRSAGRYRHPIDRRSLADRRRRRRREALVELLRVDGFAVQREAGGHANCRPSSRTLTPVGRASACNSTGTSTSCICRSCRPAWKATCCAAAVPAT